MLGLEPGRPQHGLAQPLQAEDEQQAPDHQPEHGQRDIVDQRRTERDNQSWPAPTSATTTPSQG